MYLLRYTIVNCSLKFPNLGDIFHNLADIGFVEHKEAL